MNAKLNLGNNNVLDQILLNVETELFFKEASEGLGLNLPYGSFEEFLEDANKMKEASKMDKHKVNTRFQEKLLSHTSNALALFAKSHNLPEKNINTLAYEPQTLQTYASLCNLGIELINCVRQYQTKSEIKMLNNYKNHLHSISNEATSN